MSRNPVLYGKGSFKQMWALGHTWDPPGVTGLRAGVDSFSWEKSLVILIFGQEVQEFRCESGLAERGKKEQITGYLLTQKCLHCSVSAGVVWVSGWKGTAVCECKHISHALHINPQNQQRRNAVTSFWICYSLMLTSHPVAALMDLLLRSGAHDYFRTSAGTILHAASITSTLCSLWFNESTETVEIPPLLS